MLFDYGPYLPVRILEEIRFWKQQEADETEVIKAIVPELPPDDVKLLDEWKQMFTYTQEATQRLLNYELSSRRAESNPQFILQTQRLLSTASRQSDEFVRQLEYMFDQRDADNINSSVQKIMAQQITRKSRFFAGALEAFNQPEAIASRIGNSNAAYDPFFNAEAYPGTRNMEPIVNSQPLEPKQTERNEEPSTDDSRIFDHPVPIGGHTLPPLPYPYNALEPYIDEKTMRIHHDKHHKTYVDDLNKAEKKLQEARKTGDFDLVKHWERELAFNGAGHYLHTIFWDIMNPKGGGKPEGELLEQIKRDFGSYEAFHHQFSQAALKVEGGGWAILVWSPRSHRLEILTAEKHQNLSQWDNVPLLALDVWEHAYYLKHQNDRAKYIADWWNVVYWPAVADRYQAAKKLKWQPF